MIVVVEFVALQGPLSVGELGGGKATMTSDRAGNSYRRDDFSLVVALPLLVLLLLEFEVSRCVNMMMQKILHFSPVRLVSSIGSVKNGFWGVNVTFVSGKGQEAEEYSVTVVC